MKAFGVRPKRDLGQNFLIDSNILDVIARAADLQPGDVVLEVGGGLGVLSEFLAERVRHVHVVELDRSLEPALRDALDPHPNATLHLADAVKLDLAALDPAPGKVVANLPYGVAATVILRTVAELPAVTTWVAMVQREVGERFAAKAGTAAYGVPSVLAQLACDVRVLRPVSRTVFHPVPNVDSVLVGLTRRGPAPEPALRALVQQGFAHRRKALARSLSLAPGRGAGDPRPRACGARGDRPPGRRARRAAGARRVACAGSGAAHGGRPGRGAHAMKPLRCLAPAKINVCLFVGRPRRDGYHPLVSLVQPLSLADELLLEASESGGDDVVCPGDRRARTSRPARCTPSAPRPAGTARRSGSRSPSACPSPRAWAAAAPTPRRRSGSPPPRPATTIPACCTSWRSRSAPTSRASSRPSGA